MNINGRILFLAGVAVHLLFITGHNILAIADGLREVYGVRPLPAATESGLRTLLTNPIIAHYGVLTGIAMGYGFYAPQVGSPHVAALELLTGNRRDTLFHPGLRTSTGIMRFSSALDVIRWTTSTADTAAHRFAKHVVDQLAKRYLKRTGADSVHCRIYRIQPPGLKRPSGGIRLRKVHPRHYKTSWQP